MKRILLVILLVLLPIGSYGTQFATMYLRYSLEHSQLLNYGYFAYKRSVDICKDNSRAAFVGLNTATNSWDVFTTYDYTSGKNKNITAGWDKDSITGIHAQEKTVVLSKDCKKVAFISDTNGWKGVWISDFDGKNKQDFSSRVGYPKNCRECGDDMSAAFSLDGSKLFVSRCDEVDESFFSRPDGGINSGQNLAGCWHRMVSVDLETMEVKKIGKDYHYYQDGKRYRLVNSVYTLVTAYNEPLIIFEGSTYKTDPPSFQLYSMDYEGNNLKSITESIQGDASFPRISYDDKYIVFNVKDAYKGGKEWYRAILTDRNGTFFREVREGDLFQRPYPIWFPSKTDYIVGLWNYLPDL